MFEKKSLINNSISIGLFFLISVALFYPQLQGKKYTAGDTMEARAKGKEISDLRQELGRQILWSDAIFSGMPSYFVKLTYTGNVFRMIDKVFLGFIKRPIGMFLLGMIVAFIALKSLGVKHWLSTIGAIGVMITTNNFILFEAGHMSKVMTIIYLPFLLSGMILLFRDKRLWGFILFALGSVMTIYENHPQMIYYFALTSIPYILYETYQGIKSGRALKIGGVYLLLLIAVVSGVLANASRLWTTMEYAEASTRGGSVLTKESQTNTEEGLGWQYAMQWSNGFVDLVPSIIPGAAGGSSQEPVPHDTQLERALQQNNGQKKGDKYLGPLYWGNLPFTSGAIYFGASLILLTVFGFRFLTVNERWLYGGAIIITLFLSLGKNAAFLNKTLFDYFPMFNNFRAPNSALSILPMFLSFAAFTGINRWIGSFKKSKKGKSLKVKIPKKVWIATGIVAGFCLIVALIGPSLFSFEGVNAENYRSQNVLGMIVEAREALLKNDAWRSLLMVILAFIPIWMFYHRKIKTEWLFSLSVGVIFLIDIAPISYRYFHMDKFATDRQYESTFQMRPIDEQILSREDHRADYRVLDYSINTFNSNMTSYYHNTIGGYHALKMSRYQDLIDGHISTSNQRVLNMLNTKYIIGRDGKLNVNSQANGTAWFVQDLIPVHTPDEEFRALDSINTRNQAVVLMDEFQKELNGKTQWSAAGSVTQEKKIPDDLSYKTNNSGEGLLVLSELWYDGPGWEAYIDGEEVPIVRVNFALRAVVVPAGEHTIEFKFRPASYLVGERVSLGISLGLLLLILGGIYSYWKGGNGLKFWRTTNEEKVN